MVVKVGSRLSAPRRGPVWRAAHCSVRLGERGGSCPLIGAEAVVKTPAGCLKRGDGVGGVGIGDVGSRKHFLGENGHEHVDIVRDSLQALRLQIGEDEVKVLVRYPDGERRSVGNVSSMRIRMPDGSEVPFRTVATVEEGRGYATIDRTDRRRVVTVSADVDPAVANANEINAQLRDTVLPQLVRDFLAWTETEAAERVVAEAGYVDQSLTRTPLSLQGMRLANAVTAAGGEVPADRVELTAVAAGSRLRWT